MTVYTKDPQAVLDYAQDWTAWLAAAETISTVTVTAAAGLTVAPGPTPPAPVAAAGVVTYWLTGGTEGQVYAVTVHITTNQGRTDDRTDLIKVEQR